MAKRSVSETILRLAAGRDRGAAIYGDLVEMAATRGRAWFWMAYARTLAALTWRTTAALVAGIVFFDLLDKLTRGDAGLTLWVAYMASPVLANVGAAFLILIPYATVRYGPRDRMVRLAWVTFVLCAIAGRNLSPPSIFAALTAILVVALCIRTWRGPAAVLITVVAVGAGMSACFPGTTGWYPFAVLTLPVMMLVCSGLRKRLAVSAAPRTDARA